PSANVQVKGSVIQGACTPTLENSGVIDYGSTNTNNLSSTSQTMLQNKKINLNIQCSAPTIVGLSAIDNRNGTEAGVTVMGTGTFRTNYPYAANGELFGLGLTSSGKNIGAATLYINTQTSHTDATGDSVIIYKDNGGKWSLATSGLFGQNVQ
ncbi:DUF1120 domain-containing protein, partial [Serratia marcescens]|uniref:DUF1120 domain-containing protein n=1 Tax=Serratia marcescens TaxID=615 RepID=UPI0011E6D7D7